MQGEMKAVKRVMEEIKISTELCGIQSDRLLAPQVGTYLTGEVQITVLNAGSVLLKH